MREDARRASPYRAIATIDTWTPGEVVRIGMVFPYSPFVRHILRLFWFTHNTLRIKSLEASPVARACPPSLSIAVANAGVAWGVRSNANEAACSNGSGRCDTDGL